jgi:uncharacterized RDD family membrane protein YckC
LKRQEKIDTLQSVELAEGVEIRLRPAGPMTRAWAFVIDTFLRIVFLIVIILVISLLAGAMGGEVSGGIFLITLFLIEWFYPTLFEAGKRGATPGKRMLGLRVVRESGAPISFGQSLLRNLLRAADMMPFAYGFGVVSCLFTRKFQRLGDLAAGTLVIYSESRMRKALPIQLHLAASAPRVPLHREEQVAITQFLERASLWSDERRIELADQLEELTGQTGQQGVAEVFAIAQWLSDSRGVAGS